MIRERAKRGRTRFVFSGAPEKRVHKNGDIKDGAVLLYAVIAFNGRKVGNGEASHGLSDG